MMKKNYNRNKVQKRFYSYSTLVRDNSFVIDENGGNDKMKVMVAKDFKLGTRSILRGGVIPYVIEGGETFFCFGLDREHTELTDFGGKIEHGEMPLKGALREWREESLNVFENYELDNDTDIIIYNSKMMILFKLIKGDRNILSNNFNEKYENECAEASEREKRNLGFKYPEVEELVWVSKNDLIEMVNKNFGSMYELVRLFCQKNIEIIKKI
jgi:hypothetical protein